ncbi:MAG TPA: Crp/Fnr family transcriptional regulator [Herpetosiphon sp.]|jgi:CRP/FNR family transcriptional regulator, cyclic AMP receptor protein|uniref:Transcriptional regulator, Crp/Fnr family n=2 Tax=Herpetosiphon TaxID=64 RepID=A9B2S1_HERA2|nr:Crp/Fnr family transcriptional regulator [Herpetosiphon sp.]ABX05522.1 transcriptional regulator, Crp/Fnr family [Herpetosiphon aurantiacus DSM 785]HBW51181.1 Crp/Fnr family transcriptional regulator [Herpetosiphon sp.]
MSVDVEVLRQFTRFAALDPLALRDLARAMEVRSFRPGQYLVLEDDPRFGLFGILEGRVRLSRTASDGREQVLSIAETGELFNIEPFVDAGPAPATARAMAPTRCVHLPTAALPDVLRSHPEFTLILLRDLAAQARDLAVLLEDLAFRTVRARLARILLHEAADGTAALTHQELAARAGTVREIIGRTLRQMSDEGLVELARGHVLVLDMQGLAALIEN